MQQLTTSVVLGIVTSLLTISTQAHVTLGRERYGVIGYGIVMYDPPCAYACIDIANSWNLDCGHEHTDGMDMGGMHMSSVSPECKATSDPFLQTLAWCFHAHCPGVSNSTLERVWEMDIVGRKVVQPAPAYSYQVALSRAAQAPPTSIISSDATLNITSLVDDEAWLGKFNGDEAFERMEIRASTFGLVLFVSCVGIPIVFSWFRFLPLNPVVLSKFYATVIDPPLFGNHHSAPALGLGFVPTRGQGLFIAYIWIINIIVSSVGYEVRDPMSWYPTVERQLVVYISNRVGVFSFVNLALAVLFSSRNNVLLFVTNWSHSTFLLVHRWISVICMLQACLHSAIYLQYYLDPLAGEGAHAEQSKLDYWIWGIVGTLALTLLMPLSVLPLRRKLYEAFLVTHVVLAVLAMVGCMLHIYYRYEWQWGYQTWVWISFAFWLFDRFLARPLRLARNGVKRAFVTVLDEDYLQVDIPGVEGEGHVYLYFPTLTWRVWENHPFSVAAVGAAAPAPFQEPTTTISSTASSTTSSIHSNSQTTPQSDTKTPTTSLIPSATTPPLTPHHHHAHHNPGLTFFIRRHHGLTHRLLNHTPTPLNPSITTNPNPPTGIPTLLETSYGSHLPPTTPTSLTHPNLLCIAGGVGVTGVLRFLPTGFGTSRGGMFGGKVKLFWGVRAESGALVRAVRGVVGFRGMWGGTEVTISMGRQFDIEALLERELLPSGEGHGVAVAVATGTTVVVCGPAAMADEVRVAVARLGRRGVVVRLIEESFSW
ncbi:ferric reductase like transmembrane component-domain-containing protein [Chaetomium tenue]|uniref:Ferric reductase like transmembrane component-domain-containing protein n=1 Tax=Chaetomium tenue TaxID=1854479 RepID=A0ACB7P7Z3_9PEZI|nr:ferric reductase like transmembrane component-domain-containing protein [Chaetomium globosum]